VFAPKNRHKKYRPAVSGEKQEAGFSDKPHTVCQSHTTRVPGSIAVKLPRRHQVSQLAKDG
jgi:hypothetical protein